MTTLLTPSPDIATVADLLASELGWDDRMKERQLSEFRALARHYLPS